MHFGPKNPKCWLKMESKLKLKEEMQKGVYPVKKIEW